MSTPELDAERTPELDAERTPELDAERRAERRAERSERARLFFARSVAPLLIKIAAAALVLFLNFGIVFGVCINHGNGMLPAVSDGDLLLFFRPGKGDIPPGSVVIYRSEDRRSTARIAAIPGDTVTLSETGALVVNGAPVAVGSRPEAPALVIEGSNLTFPLTVEDGHYLVIGDSDHIMEYISKKQISGRLIILIRRRGF